jgi:two-component system, LuxR family, response regulator FixJ
MIHAVPAPYIGSRRFKRSPKDGMKLDPAVLVVDDDSFMRDQLQRVFLNAGIAVQTYDSAQDLLNRADLQSRCIVLLDVKMPGMSGPELYAVLRERGIQVPVIFLTAAADVRMAVAAMRDGAADFLEKPFHSAALLERVRLTLDRYGSARPGPDPSVALRMSSLTPREREVLDLMVTGVTSKLIARTLGGSFRTIEAHRGHVMTKMAAGNLADLVRMTMES